MARSTRRIDSVRVWDGPTRLCHWALVVALPAAWLAAAMPAFFGPLASTVHRLAGQAVLILIVFRILWGLVGGSTVRWTRMFHSPLAAARHALDVLRDRDRRYLAHGPLGAYLALSLLLALTAIAVTGLRLDTPLPAAVRTGLLAWHRWLFDMILMPLLVLHVAATLLYGLLRKEPLVRGMLRGHKPRRDFADAPSLEIANDSRWRALACLVAAVVLVYALVVWTGGRLPY